MQRPEESPDAEGRRVNVRIYPYACRLQDEGASPEEIRQKLIEAGLDPREAEGFVKHLATYEAKRTIRKRAAGLLAGGAPAEEVRTVLAGQGFDAPLVAQVVGGLLEERARQEKARAEDPGPPLRLLGALVFFLGVGLALGNITGIFPTFPFAGMILTGLGALVLAIGQYRGAGA